LAPRPPRTNATTIAVRKESLQPKERETSFSFDLKGCERWFRTPKSRPSRAKRALFVGAS
jgi:hypothetical protein